MIVTGKVKAHELRTKSKSELLTQLKDLKEELSTVSI
jgi:ribosomal protein L29